MSRGFTRHFGTLQMKNLIFKRHRNNSFAQENTNHFFPFLKQYKKIAAFSWCDCCGLSFLQWCRCYRAVWVLAENNNKSHFPETASWPIHFIAWISMTFGSGLRGWTVLFSSTRPLKHDITNVFELIKPYQCATTRPALLNTGSVTKTHTIPCVFSCFMVLVVLSQS